MADHLRGVQSSFPENVQRAVCSKFLCSALAYLSKLLPSKSAWFTVQLHVTLEFYL